MVVRKQKFKQQAPATPPAFGPEMMSGLPVPGMPTPYLDPQTVNYFLQRGWLNRPSNGQCNLCGQLCPCRRQKSDAAIQTSTDLAPVLDDSAYFKGKTQERLTLLASIRSCSVGAKYKKGATRENEDILDNICSRVFMIFAGKIQDNNENRRRVRLTTRKNLQYKDVYYQENRGTSMLKPDKSLDTSLTCQIAVDEIRNRVEMPAGDAVIEDQTPHSGMTAVVNKDSDDIPLADMRSDGDRHEAEVEEDCVEEEKITNDLDVTFSVNDSVAIFTNRKTYDIGVVIKKSKKFKENEKVQVLYKKKRGLFVMDRPGSEWKEFVNMNSIVGRLQQKNVIHEKEDKQIREVLNMVV